MTEMIDVPWDFEADKLRWSIKHDGQEICSVEQVKPMPYGNGHYEWRIAVRAPNGIGARVIERRLSCADALVCAKQQLTDLGWCFDVDPFTQSKVE